MKLRYQPDDSSGEQLVSSTRALLDNVSVRCLSAATAFLFVGLAVFTFGCSTSTPKIDAAPRSAALQYLSGTLHVLVSDWRTTHAFTLEAGLITLARADAPRCLPSDGSPLMVNCVHRVTPCAASRDGNFVAFGAKRSDDTSLVAYDVAVVGAYTADPVATMIKRRRADYVESIAWSPDGEHIAILAVQERTAKSPLALLTALSGHPVQRQAFRVEIYSRDGEFVGETQYMRAFVGASGHVCWS